MKIKYIIYLEFLCFSANKGPNWTQLKSKVPVRVKRHARFPGGPVENRTVVARDTGSDPWSRKISVPGSQGQALQLLSLSPEPVVKNEINRSHCKENKAALRAP